MKKLSELDNNESFIPRHIGPNDVDIKEMLETTGYNSLDELINKTVPEAIRLEKDISSFPPQSESQALQKLKNIAQQNKVFRSLIGMGYYDTIMPAVIQRNVLENPGWYTAYTPYQPEISQGRLEALLTFQQVVMDLTAMEIANASLLDEATAAAEAMALAHRMNKKSKSHTFLVDQNCHPQTIAVLTTRAIALGLDVIVDELSSLLTQDGFGLLIQYPATNGHVQDYTDIISRCHDNNIFVTMATDLMALALLKPPGEMGADIVVGNSQRFGVPIGYGGPHAAFMATKDEYKRSVPGRIVGVSVDKKGNTAYRLALQTREQHIRREKATSNICTAQVLLANLASFYAVYHGAEGLKNIAQRIHRLTSILSSGLKTLNIEVSTNHFFDTLTINAGNQSAHIIERGYESKINLRDFGNGDIAISLDEKSTAEEIKELWSICSGKGHFDFSVESIDQELQSSLPDDLIRKSDYLTHPVFNSYHSETEMLRYLRRLEQKDIALNRSMIPLGSCTMKLNATSEMLPITWPEFANIHPFAPGDQTDGYRTMILELENQLCELTGFSAVSFQPNAGSQGEFAGLLAIHAYHQSRNDTERNICLIPASAHGTNPASAVMASMKVIVVKCDEAGNIDVVDLKEKATTYKDVLSALMVTYPSTHGVFEESIKEICEIIHNNGGQVYMDGANLNAMLGIARPADFGADVMHMNLHKTFSIPHGGGGPGVGPIGVVEHLIPFLPSHPLISEEGIGAISAAEFGSASILPISWMYITMMGVKGLKQATEIAILNANYIASSLEDSFPVLYKGKNETVAHECILDTRELQKQAHITVEDIAKRLMDFGFHAPTMSFPVPGTLMIEPTESENKEELDRFIEAMKKIRQEMDKIIDGTYSQEDNPLINAPHTMEEISAKTWEHCYTREEAAFPANYIRHDKYWPPVSRIDNAQGDRHFICTCPSIEEYEQEAA